MAHKEFQLKHSRFSIVFQLVIILLISFILYQVLSVQFFSVALALLFLSLFFFKQKSQIEYFAYLDDDVWSLKFQNNKKIHRVKIKNILNHQLYVVIEFEQSEHKPLIIWLDQLNRIQWKNLKILSLLK